MKIVTLTEVDVYKFYILRKAWQEKLQMDLGRGMQAPWLDLSIINVTSSLGGM